MAAGEFSDASRLFAKSNTDAAADPPDMPNQSVIEDKCYRLLMGLGVSPIGLGCLPMVGYG